MAALLRRNETILGANLSLGGRQVVKLEGV
jgi:hypothetical protein